MLGHGAVLLIISDGWNRGDIDLLEHEMACLQRSCHRLIWLNSLLGSPNYEPLTRGIRAALPYIDDFLPVHNLVSLEDLAEHLANLSPYSLSTHRPPSAASLAGQVWRAVPGEAHKRQGSYARHSCTNRSLA